MLGVDIDNSNTTLLFAADNVDHNVLTLDGKGSFHGMGMIAAMTPGQKTFQVVPPHITSQLDISEQSKVSIIDYKFAKHARENAKFVNMPVFPETNDSIDLLWELSFHFKQATPGWNGMSISSTMKTTIRESLQSDICLCWTCTQVTEHAYFQLWSFFVVLHLNITWNQ